MLLVNKQYCLNCYWRDLLREGDLRSDDTKVRAHVQGTCRIMNRRALMVWHARVLAPSDNIH